MKLSKSVKVKVYTWKEIKPKILIIKNISTIIFSFVHMKHTGRGEKGSMGVCCGTACTVGHSLVPVSARAQALKKGKDMGGSGGQ